MIPSNRPEKLLSLFLLTVILTVTASGILFHFFGIDLYARAPDISICPFRLITKSRCPGCGMTRSMLLVGQLRLKEAFVANIFALPLFILIVLRFFWGDRLARGFDRRWIWFALFLVLAYWILRNLWGI